MMTKTLEASPWLNKYPWLTYLVIALAYLVLARIGLSLQFEQTQASPVWPPSGLAITAIFLLGVRAIPAIFVGAFLANIIDFYLKSNQLDAGFFSYLASHPKELIVSIVIGLGNTLEAVAAWFIASKWIKDLNIFNSNKGISQWVCVIVLASMVSATIGVAALVLSGILPEFLTYTVWFTWMLGDATGALILMPLLVFWLAKGDQQYVSSLQSKDPKKIAFALLLTISLTLMIFIELGDITFFQSQAYILLPVLFYLVVNFEAKFTFINLFFIATLAVYGTTSGLGPFEREQQNESLIILQGFIATLSIVSLLVYNLLRQILQSQAKLREANLLLEEQNLTLEDAVKERTKELEKSNRDLMRSNKELDDFAYISSHDLKEPLRGIENHIAFLLEDYGDQLSEELLERLNKLPPITKHMENLIQQLLVYSRVGRAELAIQQTDLNKVLDEVLQSLSARFEQLGIELNVKGNLPTLECDHTRVGEIFRNLITNAMKYNDKEQKTIEIGSTEHNDRKCIYVKDNGIGIRDNHREKIFQIFKRLHGRNKFGGGSGAGMTIVKKLVEKHEGEIWLDSVYGEGTTFYFTLWEQE